MADKTITKSSTMTSDYYKQTQIDQTLRLREVLKTLPPFAKDYFRAMEPKSSAKTRIIMHMISGCSFIFIRK